MLPSVGASPFWFYGLLYLPRTVLPRAPEYASAGCVDARPAWASHSVLCFQSLSCCLPRCRDFPESGLLFAVVVTVPLLDPEHIFPWVNPACLDGSPIGNCVHLLERPPPLVTVFLHEFNLVSLFNRVECPLFHEVVFVRLDVADDSKGYRGWSGQIL